MEFTCAKTYRSEETNPVLTHGRYAVPKLVQCEDHSDANGGID